MDQAFLNSFLEVENRHWWFRARRDLLIGLLAGRLEEGARLLDLGSGTGFFLEAAEEKWEVHGLDPSEDAVEACRARGLSGVRQGRIEDAEKTFPLRFDAVTLLDVIEHIDDDIGALRTAKNLLKPTGVLLVTVPAYQWLWSGHDVINEHRRRYTRRSLAEAFSEAGISIEGVTYFNGLLLPLAVAARLGGRLLRRAPPKESKPPPAPIGAVFERVFRFEKRFLCRKKLRGLPVGLSVIGVGRV